MNGVIYYKPQFIKDPTDKKLIIGFYIFRNKGKKCRGRKNYPPLPVKPKTGRKNQMSIRGLRRALRLEDRARSRFGADSDARVERASEFVRNLFENNPELARLQQIRLRHQTSFYVKD